VSVALFALFVCSESAEPAFTGVSTQMSDVDWPGFVGVSEAARLLLAAFIGTAIAAVQRYTRRGHQLGRSLEQAHVLLCLAGALTMVIVGESLARAFGIAGAAAIVRFRTAVDDPSDVTVLFLLMALGMAAGLGLIAVAVVGTMFVCGCLVALRHTDRGRVRAMKVALIANGHRFPAAHVSHVFAHHHITVEPLELSNGDQAAVRYRALINRDTSIDEVSAELLNGGARH
jgi:hypothetical protein